MLDIESFVRGLPKADLHMHLEGSIEPQLMLDIATRNGLRLRWDSADALRAAYQFTSLQSFLDLYYEGCKVLVTERDFYDVTRAYLRRAHEDGVIRSELFIGPQSFTTRDVAIETLMSGVLRAMDDASREQGTSVGLLISVQRHRTEADALAVLDQIMPWADRIIGIGMGGAEVGNPPSKFARFFKECRKRGFRTTVHAGEEGPASYVRQALSLLQVDRIDHGNACLADPDLVRELADKRIALTICPLSNVRLHVVPSMDKHPLKELMARGLHVTINSDDPPYFDGYVTENLLACRSALGLSLSEIVGLARNGLCAAFVSEQERQDLLCKLDAYLVQHDSALQNVPARTH
ncbi:adenosine deaminase [Bradyrhizobium sp. LTSP885]|uniref:adenosine deaminase n=1 Tax=Bradyrhizobium sp. LTSP885 TaxID=1619232 RepID=UPI0005C9887A|nr:adenosine deaminase [Bradyrhizobium sp. LTSP885]